MTTTTTRGALLRRAGSLLVATTLLTAPAASAFAEPTPDASSSPAATGSPAATATTSTSAPGSTSTIPAPSPTSSETSTTTPAASPTAPATSPTTSTPSVAAVAQPALASTAAEDAAAFIARTLAEGDDHYVYPNSTYFDGGNTIDAIVALATAGTQQAQADASLAYLEANLATYLGAGGEAYAGPIAKALLGVVVAGGDPRSFGGADLVAQLQALETTAGRFSDDSAYGDYSNTIGQSLALIALSRAGQGLNAASVELLLDQQCADGGFRGSLGGETCTSDADATAFAVQGLLAASRTLVCGNDSDDLPARAELAAGAALDWLEEVQDPSGGLESADGVLNANTAGVAAQAFLAGGRTPAAGAAIAFIGTLQYDAASPEPLRGGIAFSAATRSTSVPSDSDLRATPQAALALLGSSLLDAAGPGVEDPAPGTTCPPEPTRQPVTVPKPSTPAGPSTPVSSGGPTSGSGGSTGSGDGASSPGHGAPTGSLAQTGTDLLLPVGLGLLLVVLGAAAVVASRRQGAHL